MKLLPFGALICALGLFGCAQEKIWLKPGATQNDFGQDRYACLQQSQQGASVASVGRYGGYATSGIITNDTLFSACMNSHGWSLTAKASETGSTEFKSEVDAIKAEGQEVCTRDDLKALFKKMPCVPKDASLAQLSDHSKITAIEKVALSKWRTLVTELNKKASAVARQYNPQSGAVMASAVDNIQIEGEKKALELYDGQITWGEFNKWRLERASRA